jgi:hypothetical protein
VVTNLVIGPVLTGSRSPPSWRPSRVGQGQGAVEIGGPLVDALVKIGAGYRASREAVSGASERPTAVQYLDLRCG